MKKINKKYREYIKGFRCLISNKECGGDIVAHHVKHKNAGWGDESNLVPLCFNHHTWNNGIHAIGKIRFQEKYDLDLDRIAAMIYEHWGKNASKN